MRNRCETFLLSVNCARIIKPLERCVDARIKILTMLLWKRGVNRRARNGFSSIWWLNWIFSFIVKKGKGEQWKGINQEKKKGPKNNKRTGKTLKEKELEMALLSFGIRGEKAWPGPAHLERENKNELSFSSFLFVALPFISFQKAASSKER